MAASMENQHKRRKPCVTRPIYRDGRKERAVKVFTINQESRYLLVQGVPDIKITDELLKLFSLYGTIEEYRIMDDLPAEEFTKNYWIKYKDIHAARIAKRKMDDHSFYGGFLHVTYAPEYETIQDTREKLQQRRMDVARRLRKLTVERAADDPEESIETISASSTTTTMTTPTEVPPTSKPSIAWESQTSQSVEETRLNQRVEGAQVTPQEASNTGSVGAWPNESQDPLYPTFGHSETSFLQSLPAPPRSLPPWQWNLPSQPEFPRLRTTHETLPAGFDPFPNRGDHPGEGSDLRNHLTQPPPLPPPPVPHLAPPGTFIGPQHPSKPNASQSPTEERNAGLEGSATALQAPAGRSDCERTRYLESGARPKVRTGDDTSARPTHHHAFQMQSVNPQAQCPKTEPGARTEGVAKQGEARDLQEGGGGGDGGVEEDSNGSSLTFGAARPKLVGRRRLGPQPAGSSRNQGARVSRLQFVPRVVSTSTKRPAEDDAEDQEMTSLPVTGSASFDQTVSAIRQQMFQASNHAQPSAAPTTQLDAAIVQSRNQERMGTLPRRPPVKRQRI